MAARKAPETPSSPSTKRPTRRRTSERLTISLPIEIAVRLRADAQAAGAPSVSAYVAETLAQHAHKESFRDVLDELFREQPMTDEEQAWADAILDRSPSTPAR